jgi:UDP-glucuronate 4-epimerase
LIYENSLVPFFGDGGSARDYTYIDDIIQGVLGSLDFPQSFEVFNLLVKLIENISGRKARLQHLPEQPGDVEITYADVSKARRLLGYNPVTPIEVGLRRFIEWYEAERVHKHQTASL